MGRRKPNISTGKSLDNPKLQHGKFRGTHSLMSPIPSYRMPPPQLPPEYTGSPVQPRYGMRVAGSLPQPVIPTPIYPAPAFREMSPVRGMFDPGSPRHVPPATIPQTAEASPSVNITWKGNSLFRPRIPTDVVRDVLQSRANGIGSPMAVQPAGVPSMSRASLMPRSCVPDTDTGCPVPGFRRILPATGNFSPGCPVPGFRRILPAAGNFSPGTSKPVPSSLASLLSLSTCGALEEKTLIEESNDRAFNINSLPEELLIIIFGYLTQNELGRIARVCRKWGELTRRQILWKKVNVKFYGHHGSQTGVVKNFVMTLPSSVTDIRFDFMFCTGWTEPLKFVELCVWLQERCPQLEVLFLKGAELTFSLPAVINICGKFLQNVKSLTLRSVKFCDRSKMRKFYDLPKIKIKVLNLYACNLKKTNELKHSQMPILKELNLTNTNIDDTWFDVDPIFFKELEVLHLGFISIGSRAFQIIQNNGLYLKELYLCGTRLEDKDLIFNNPVLPHLKTICLTYCYYALTSEGVVSLVQSCQALENVYVEKKLAESYADHPYILLNRCKLEIVKVYSCYYHYPRNFYT